MILYLILIGIILFLIVSIYRKESGHGCICQEMRRKSKETHFIRQLTIDERDILGEAIEDLKRAQEDQLVELVLDYYSKRLIMSCDGNCKRIDMKKE